MKPRLSAFFLCASLALAVQARATVLPDACGDDKVRFEVRAQENPPQPAAPAAEKAQIVFIETMDRGDGKVVSPKLCVGCNITTRVGVDGAWVGANYGDSYFTLDLIPGEHHLCADWQSASGRLRGMVGVNSFTAESGKVYYYQVKVTEKQVSKEDKEESVAMTPLSEDEGKYLVKNATLSAASPKK
jgi:hypothetical protein